MNFRLFIKAQMSVRFYKKYSFSVFEEIPSQKVMAQDFIKLKRKLLKNGKLFEDPLFKPSQETYSFEDGTDIKWLRPKEICKDPRFEIDGISRFNVKQGGLNDCWFLAALSSLAENELLFRKVVPKDNDSDFEKDYAGIFHFKLVARVGKLKFNFRKML